MFTTVAQVLKPESIQNANLLPRLTTALAYW